MPLERTQIVALANQKGGCGKTTSAVSLAAGVAREGYSVCLVDTDPQCNATDTFGVSRDELATAGKFTVADAYLNKKPASEIQLEFAERFEGRLTLVPGHRGLGALPHRLEAQLQATIANDNYSELDADDLKNEQRKRLKNSIASLRSRRDVVFIDTPPELGFLMTSSLIAADWFIIPIFPSGYDLKGLETLTKTVDKVRSRFNPQLRLLGVLVGNFDARAKLDSDVYKMLATKFGDDRLFETRINRSVKHREATVYGRTIFEHAAGEQAAEQCAAVASELIQRLQHAEQPSKRPAVDAAEVKEVAHA